MRAIKTGDPDKKKKRQQKRAAKKNGSLTVSNSVLMNSSTPETKGSCEDGNLRACKTKVKVAPKFNPKKRKISKKRLVKSKKEKPEKQKQTNQERYSNPRFL
jgi:hypothetical protein